MNSTEVRSQTSRYEMKMPINKARWGALLTASTLLFAAACGESGDLGTPNIDPTEPQPVPSVGQTSFVSADGQNGQASQDNTESGNNLGAEASADDAAADERSVEEGDIYRVTDTGHILNLNSFRGLQIIDFSDPTNPQIVGRVQVSGTPVEMYQVGNRVFMLLNNWRGYYGSRTDVQGLLPDTFEGGVVVVADISNPAAPKVTARGTVPGWIQSSRLTRGGGKEALYVVANSWADGNNTTYVKSFSVSGAGKLDSKTEVDLGGYVTDIQATGDRLMVARHDWQRGNGSKVSVIDISDPNGTMVEGQSVQVAGMVQNKYNMDIDGDVLRVVSGNNWSSNTNTNHVETFNVSNLQAITPIDSDTFGDGEQLFATLFLGNKAFFVTYLRVDPFHAFEIAADGTITEKSEFIVSGWNDYFKPVESQSRLIGIGKNDQNGNTMAVSLYDITDLTNPSPMITREEIDLNWSWSEASWDDRAFTVLEKGTAVVAPDGQTIETGLVLLPFSGWDDQTNTYVSAVQIFTFSRDTLTLRGSMDHGTPVRRSFVADRADNTTGNISEVELSLFDTSNTDAPTELGRVPLAPNYSDFFVFGNHGIRRANNSGYWGWWGRNSTIQPTDELEVVSLSSDVDAAEATSTIAIPAGAQVYKVNNKLVTVSTRPKDPNNYQDGWESQVDVYDFTNPLMAVQVGSELYDDLPNTGYYYGWYGGIDDCFDCSLGGYYYGYGAQPMTVGDALIFPESVREQERVGTMRRRYIRPADNSYRWERCWSEDGEAKACTYVTGGISCERLTRLDGTVQDEVCYGSFDQCTQTIDGETTCNDVDPNAVATVESMSTNDQYRHWNRYRLHVVDVSNPAAIPVTPTVLTMQRNEEAAGLLARGSDLYLTYKKPVFVAGDSRPYVAYFFRKYGLANPATPVVGADINIPGMLVEADGSTLITRDYLWGNSIVETSLNKLELQNNTALLKGVRRFADEEVMQVQADGAGHILVTRRTAWRVNRDAYGNYGYDQYDRTVRLSVLDLNTTAFVSLSDSDIDDWANLQASVAGRALFTVPGGMLVVNIDDATAPAAQAYFPLRGWPQSLTVEGRSIYFAAGLYGLYDFDIDATNLLPSPN